MEFNVRRVGRLQTPDDAHVVLSRRRLISEDFSGRHLVQFSAEGVRMEQCRFDHAVIESGSFGAGRLVSEYVGCSFDDAKITMGPGGYARFIDCSFEGTEIDNWFCFAVELVGCTFSGRMRKVVFNGAVPPDKRDVAGRSTNRFENNDFSRAKLIEVAFRTGIDLSRQRLPSGSDYVYLADAMTGLRRARMALNTWDDPDDKKRAGNLLSILDDEVANGQHQLLLRVADYPRASRPPIQALLDAALMQ
jgi:hypothetical protein